MDAKILFKHINVGVWPVQNPQISPTPCSSEVQGFIMDLKLFNNVQFIYELALAELELQSLGVDYSVGSNLRTFSSPNDSDVTTLKKKAAYFQEVDGKTTDYSHLVSRNITRSPNQYLTHWIYPYKGKYHPQMIRALLNVIGAEPGNVVLDPFIGSGTTVLECQLLGIDSLGIDVSQVCTLISKVKTESFEVLEEIEGQKEEIFKGFQDKTLFDFDSFKDEKKASPINILGEIQNEKVKNFYKVAELISHSDRSRRRKKDFFQSYQKNVENMITSTRDFKDVVEEMNLPLGNVQVGLGDARNLELKDNSVDGIITSPPYSIALDYVKNDAHSLSALGYDLDKVKEDFIGVRGTGKTKVDLYNHDMEKSYKEMHRVLKDGKKCVIVIGNATIQGEEVATVDMTVNCFEKMGFTLEKNMDKIIFGLYNIMQRENILIFKKNE
jgi:DNA modification methylase